MVESASDDILHDAQNVDVAFLVVGDPFGYVPFEKSWTEKMLTDDLGQPRIPILFCELARSILK
jgi:hypothetical protein